MVAFVIVKIPKKPLPHILSVLTYNLTKKLDEPVTVPASRRSEDISLLALSPEETKPSPFTSPNDVSLFSCEASLTSETKQYIFVNKIHRTV